MDTRVVSALPRATGFTRMAMALAAQHGDLYKAAAYARAHWGRQTPEVGPAIEKLAVLPQSTADAALIVPGIAAEFTELLRAATIIDRIPGIRRVLFNCVMARVTAGSSAHWIGESAPTAVSRLTLDQPATRISHSVSDLATFDRVLAGGAANVNERLLLAAANGGYGSGSDGR